MQYPHRCILGLWDYSLRNFLLFSRSRTHTFPTNSILQPRPSIYRVILYRLALQKWHLLTLSFCELLFKMLWLPIYNSLPMPRSAPLSWKKPEYHPNYSHYLSVILCEQPLLSCYNYPLRSLSPCVLLPPCSCCLSLTISQLYTCLKVVSTYSVLKSYQEEL